MGRWRVLLGAVVVLLAATGGGAFYAIRRYDAPGPLTQARAVVVPRGGLDVLADALVRDGVVSSGIAFQGAAIATGRDGSLKAGELEFPAAASLRQVLAVLRTAHPVQHKLTIPEGLTAAQIALLLEKAPALDGEAPLPPEGGLLPETYSYERGTARAALMERMVRAMDRALERNWAGRAPDLPLAAPRDAVILASIVERETGKPEERPRVAAVFLNRLRRGMKLQSDPTVAYGASGGLGVLDHGLTRAELDRDDPYNTYKIAGLPPGPICMPGLSALKAVLQPAVSEDLFFVADGTGGHVFARSEQDHNRNVVRWREVERARIRPLP